MSAVQISSQELIDNACIYGQKSSHWNPKMKPFIAGKIQNTHVIDPNISAEKMAELLNRVSELASKGKNILFVCTKPLAYDFLKQIHVDTGMPVVSYKWFGGLLTNFATIKERIKYMKQLQEEFESGSITRYTKKEQAQFKKELAKLEEALLGVVSMNKLPDAVFVVDGFRDKIAIDEARHIGIEVLGIADTNANPDLYDVFVPANDDSLKSVSFILGHVVTAILAAK